MDDVFKYFREYQIDIDKNKTNTYTTKTFSQKVQEVSERVHIMKGNNAGEYFSSFSFKSSVITNDHD